MHLCISSQSEPSIESDEFDHDDLPTVTDSADIDISSEYYDDVFALFHHFVIRKGVIGLTVSHL